MAVAEGRGLGGLRSPRACVVLRRQQEDAWYHLTRLQHILDMVRAGGDRRGQGWGQGPPPPSTMPMSPWRFSRRRWPPGEALRSDATRARSSGGDKGARSRKIPAPTLPAARLGGCWGPPRCL